MGRTEKHPKTGIHPQAGGIPADRVCAGSSWEVQMGIFPVGEGSLWETVGVRRRGKFPVCLARLSPGEIPWWEIVSQFAP